MGSATLAPLAVDLRWQAFRRWSLALQEAAAWGDDDVPDIHDLDSAVVWLYEHGEIVPPETTEFARKLIAECLRTGRRESR